MQDPKHPLFSAFNISLSLHHIGKEAERATGLTLVQWYVLKRLIEMPGVSAQDLAQTVGVDPSSLTQSLKRLSRKELIFVAEDPKDSRKKLISITRGGKEALDRAETKMKKIGDELYPVRAELCRVESRLLERRLHADCTRR